MTTFTWLDEATSKIVFGPDREIVRRELEGHLLDRQERYLAQGMDEAAAEEAAVADMGDPSEIAEELGRIHRPWWGWIWQASRVLIRFALVFFVCLLLIQYQQLDAYLTWEGTAHFIGEELLESRSFEPDRVGKSGDYTFHIDGITVDTVGKGEPFRVLYIDVRITRPLWTGECSISDALHTVTDSTGTVYSTVFAGSAPHFYFRDIVQTAIGQKFRLMLWYVPEDVDWVELGIGYGELARQIRLEVEP